MRVPVETVVVITFILTGSLLSAHACDSTDLDGLKRTCMVEVMGFLNALYTLDTPHQQLCFAFEEYLGCVYRFSSRCLVSIYDAMVDRKHELRGCDTQFIAQLPSVPVWRRGFH